MSAGLLLPEFLVSCKKSDPGPEIVFDGTVAVIGAGAAGLYAADILKAKGLNVIVFEASTQLGGRIRSLRNQIAEFPVQSIADFPVELGAEIVYGSNSIWNKIIKNYNIPMVDLAGATDQFILDNLTKTATEWGSDPDLKAVQNFVATLPNYAGADVSVKQAAGVSARAQALLNGRVGNFYGSSADRVGAKGLAEGLKLIDRDAKWLSISTNPMQDILLSRFNDIATKVLLNTPIVSINYGGDKVILTDKSNKQYEVDKVVITVPHAVLKSSTISFSPGLPASFTSSLSKIGMDACIKVVLDFKKNFWGNDTGFIWGGTTAPQFFNAGVGRSSLYQTLSFTISGPKAEELSSLSNLDIVKAVLAEMDIIYAGQGTQFVRRAINSIDNTNGEMIYFVKNWTKDEFIKGGWSYPLIGATLQDRKNLATPVGNKLFFAGEATDIKGDGGTMNGAFNSAERVVEDVVKSITG